LKNTFKKEHCKCVALQFYILTSYTKGWGEVKDLGGI
jgi:hypothetical protein